jgi:hypothetical protein
MKKNLIFTLSLIIGLLFPKTGLSQADSLSSSVSDSSKKAETPAHSVYIGAGYGSNMVYLGSTISQDQPFGYAALTYSFKGTLFLTASAVSLSKLDPITAFYTGSLGFSHTFNQWFDISAGVSRYQVHKSLTDTLFNSFNYADLNLGFDWKILYTKVSVGGLISEQSSIYLQLKNSRYFETPDFFRKKLNISFDPYFNILFGKMTEVETTTGTEINLYPPFRKGASGSTTTTTKYTEIFGLMELDFGLPIALNASRFTIEIEPGYILPVYEDPAYPGTKGFLVMASAYIKIF